MTRFLNILRVVAYKLRCKSCEPLDDSEEFSAGAIGLARALSDYDGEKGVPLNAWLASNIRWQILDNRRRLRRDRIKLVQMDRIGDRHPFAPPISRHIDDIDEIMVLLKHHPIKRQILALYAESYNLPEISRIMNLSKTTISTHLRSIRCLARDAGLRKPAM